MTILEAIEIVERWKAGGFATRIENMIPALNLLIEAGKRIKFNRVNHTAFFRRELPGETTEQ